MASKPPLHDATASFPQPAFHSVITGGGLSDDEWTGLCKSCGINLSATAREQIDWSLVWCIFEKQKRDGAPRMSRVKQQMRSFVKGADTALEAIGYLAAAGITSTSERPPTNVKISSGSSALNWHNLIQTGLCLDVQDGGYWTQRAIGGVKRADLALQTLHGLAYTASRAAKKWADGAAGNRAGGDRRFMIGLLWILRDEGVSIELSQDRTADGGEEVGGPAWDVLLAIWTLRPEAFKVAKKSTLARYLRGTPAKLPEQIAPK